jgi:hypothetical protein
VYLLIKGLVKLEKTGFSTENLKEIQLIKPGKLFGEKDLKFNER